MTVLELYAEIGNYEDAKARLMNDDIIARFVVKFLDDPSYNQLITNWDNQDDEAIFRAAHTMKGVCANMAFTKLHQLASELTELYRGGADDSKKEKADLLIVQIKEEYENTIALIRAFSN